MEVLFEDMEEDEEEISEKEVPGGGDVGQEAAEKSKEEAKKSEWATSKASPEIPAGQVFLMSFHPHQH